MFIKPDVKNASCNQDSECDIKACFYCLSNGKCGKYHDDYCNNNNCGIGDGDCDEGTCSSGTICGYNNFRSFHPLLATCAPSASEVCITIGKSKPKFESDHELLIISNSIIIFLKNDIKA